MKNVIAAIAITLALTAAAFAKDDKVLTVVYTPLSVREIVIDNPYYVDDYTCTRGDENHAPTCYGPGDQFIKTESKLTVTFEDGTILHVDRVACGYLSSNALCKLFDQLELQPGSQIITKKIPYQLDKTVGTKQEIKIKGFGKTIYTPTTPEQRCAPVAGAVLQGCK